MWGIILEEQEKIILRRISSVKSRASKFFLFLNKLVPFSSLQEHRYVHEPSIDMSLVDVFQLIVCGYSRITLELELLQQ